MSKLAKTHALKRTSPIGSTFLGTCIQCGKTDLPTSAALDYCENLTGDTQESALLKALEEEVK